VLLHEAPSTTPVCWRWPERARSLPLVVVSLLTPFALSSIRVTWPCMTMAAAAGEVVDPFRDGHAWGHAVPTAAVQERVRPDLESRMAWPPEVVPRPAYRPPSWRMRERLERAEDRRRWPRRLRRCAASASWSLAPRAFRRTCRDALPGSRREEREGVRWLPVVRCRSAPVPWCCGRARWLCRAVGRAAP